MKQLYSGVIEHFSIIKLGGGKKAIEKQKERNKLTARQRVEYLLDKNQPFIEIGAFAGFNICMKNRVVVRAQVP